MKDAIPPSAPRWDPHAVSGIILAGGQSRRMGGGDKGLLDLAGRPMLAHVIERLRPQVGHLALNANGPPQRLAGFGLPVCADTIDGFVGPLAGVLAGLRWSAANAPHATHIATVSADAPLIPFDLVARLAGALDLGGAGGAQGNATGNRGTPSQAAPPAIALAASGGHSHPVIGVWPVALADDLEAALRDGVRKVLAWTDRHGTAIVAFDFIDIAGRRVDPFFNANTPDELDEARALIAAATR